MGDKPDMANLCLDDLISEEKAANFKKRSKKRQMQSYGAPANVDFTQFTDDQIRVQLEDRGLSLRGSRPKLVNRLKAEVQKAWSQYKKQHRSQGLAALMPPSFKPKKHKKKLTEEEKNEIHAKNEANRLAKAKRRSENIKRHEENQQRKRQKREESKVKQAAIKQQQKTDKEARQRCEVYVQFDLTAYKNFLRKKLDPQGNKISSLSQDFSKKGFVVKFNNANDANVWTKGATMKKKKTIKTPLKAVILPSPVESKCVFFQYPLALNHPHVAEANKWTSSQNSDASLVELQKLRIWIDSAAKHFGKYGTVLNVYRERGFLVVQYGSEDHGKKCFSGSENGTFNGVAFNFLRTGTPTKADQKECAEDLKVKED